MQKEKSSDLRNERGKKNDKSRGTITLLYVRWKNGMETRFPPFNIFGQTHYSCHCHFGIKDRFEWLGGTDAHIACLCILLKVQAIALAFSVLCALKPHFKSKRGRG